MWMRRDDIQFSREKNGMTGGEEIRKWMNRTRKYHEGLPLQIQMQQPDGPELSTARN